VRLLTPKNDTDSNKALDAVSAIKKIMAGDSRSVGHAIVEIVQTDHVDDIQNVAIIETVRSQCLDVFFA
jgi:hypothetical protein